MSLGHCQEMFSALKAHDCSAGVLECWEGVDETRTIPRQETLKNVDIHPVMIRRDPDYPGAPSPKHVKGTKKRRNLNPEKREKLKRSQGLLPEKARKLKRRSPNLKKTT